MEALEALHATIVATDTLVDYKVDTSSSIVWSDTKQIL